MADIICFLIPHFLSLFLLESYPTPLANAAIPDITTDQSALLALKASISYDPHDVLTDNWSTNTSVCNWIGVTCGYRHLRVTALNLSYMGLAGTIPPHIGNLSFLVSLMIRNNSFHGSIPNELSLLHRLRFLHFGYNEFNGEMPPWIGLLTKLQYLCLFGNNFVGKIPEMENLTMLTELNLSQNNLAGTISSSSLFKCIQLQILDLQTNNFGGVVPQEIGNLSMLTTLSIGNNNFEGSIPSTLFKCKHLQSLDLGTNNFNGVVPLEVGNLTMLLHLDLSDNKLDGTIPSSLFKCKWLQTLYLYDNNFTGSLSPEIGNFTMLRVLSLSYNKFQGAIPSEIGSLQHLKFINIGNNGFAGSIPFEIFNISTILTIGMVLNNLTGHLPSNVGLFLPNLQSLVLGGNELSGTIPNSISNASQLVLLGLSQNSFSGLMPKTLGNLRLLQTLNLEKNNLTVESAIELKSFFSDLSNCIYLRTLALSTNQLNGILPNSIGNLSIFLQDFLLYDCNVKGNIPIEIGNLSGLTFLILSNNDLIGPIPTAIGKLRMLQILGLGSNRLKGHIPHSVCLLGSLAEVSLVDNELYGDIPTCINNLTSLRGVYFGFNQLTSTFPLSLWSLTYLLEVDISSNSLSGPISTEIGNLKALITLNLSRNHLSGEIPTSIGGLITLVNLSLAFNQLEGSIPATFGESVSLELLDISNNNLSGEIPMSLEALLHLKYLNVSFNKLSGEIPTRGPFVHFSAASFMSNNALCGVARLQVPPCQSHVTRPKHIKGASILRYLLPIIGLMILVMYIVFVLITKCQKRNSNFSADEDPLPLATWRRISHQEILQATKGFSTNYLIGEGSFGSVYKGQLLDGTIVAIKVLKLQVEGAFKSFNIECEVLSNIRHRNLVKIISACSTVDFKAIVLEYMHNGNLEMWLYDDNHCLNMLQRLNIMIDVATALEYLHIGYSIPIVHSDLKPSNVLLDEDMVGHVADFGTSKLLGDGVSLTQTTTLATIGYMAPEYGSEGIVSTSGDVYSYGVLLMETFTRKKPTDDMFTGEMSLKCLVQDSLARSVLEVVDTKLLRNENDYATVENCLLSTMGLALHCCADSPEQRISIEDVLTTLEKIKSMLLKDIGGGANARM